MMLSLDFAEIATIEIIATANTITAIVPNSGTTKLPIISISSVFAGNAMVKVLSVDVFVSSKSTSSPSTITNRSSSSSLMVASITSLGRVIVIEPSSGELTLTIRDVEWILHVP